MSAFLQNLKGRLEPLTDGAEAPSTPLPLLVQTRQALLFRSARVDASGRVGEGEAEAMARALAPFLPVSCYVYRCPVPAGGQRRCYLFWLSALTPPRKARDEVPESLFFRGNPEDCRRYRLFLWRRAGGMELLVLGPEGMDSRFLPEGDTDGLSRVLEEWRHGWRLGTRPLEVCTDGPELLADLEGVVPCAVQHDATPYRVDRVLGWERVLTRSGSGWTRSPVLRWRRVLGVLSLVLLLAGLVFLVSEGLRWRRLSARLARLEPRCAPLLERLDRGELTELRLNRRWERVKAYAPSLESVLGGVMGALDRQSHLTELASGPGRMEIRGETRDSLSLRNRLEGIPGIRSVRFPAQVRKDAQSGQEAFVMELVWGEGDAQEPASGGEGS